MGFLKRTNKKFDYQPRYYKGEGNPFKIEHKLDKFRKTAGKNKGIKSINIYLFYRYYLVLLSKKPHLH